MAPYDEKLASSGLTRKDAESLHIKALTAEETQNLGKPFEKLPSMRFDYLGPDGRPLEDWPGCPAYYRVRYLAKPKTFTGNKTPKYMQPAGTLPVAYYPQIYSDWLALCTTPSQPLIITEGELKSAKASKDGFPTLGLGGVHSWRAKKRGIEWLTSMELIEWPRRDVYICFDSDYRSNEQVCAALRQLAEALQKRGAYPHIVTLPELPEFEKVGLDDFLTFGGPSARADFQTLLDDATPLCMTGSLWDFNERYVYVRNPGLVLNRHDYTHKVSPGAFKEHLESAHSVYERKLESSGNVSLKPKSAAATWLQWPLRLEAPRMTYEPGQAPFMHDGSVNIWPGWGVEPKKGKVRPFLDLIDHLFTGAEPAAKKWFLQWCAYPIQHPGTKLYSAVIFHGTRQGTGKSLVGYTLGKIYGKNFVEITQQDLESNYTEWAEAKQFVLGDEITGSDRRQHADMLKRLIVQTDIRVNIKFIPSYDTPNRMNFFFTSNHADSFYIEDHDRRYFVHEVAVDALGDEFYRVYDEWYKSHEGAAALHHYLRTVNLDGFNPAAKAYRTEARMRMISIGRSDLDDWIHHMLADPDHYIQANGAAVPRDIYTATELLHFYDPTEKTRTKSNGMARALSRADVPQAAGGKALRGPCGAQGRYYAVRNGEIWSRATPKQATQHLHDSARDTKY